MFVLLSIYFWLNVLSLHQFLKKGNQKNSRRNAIGSTANLTSEMKTHSVLSSAGSIQMIPLNASQNGSSDDNALKENAKFFIIHV